MRRDLWICPGGSWLVAQTVKEHLRGYEKGLADAATMPRSKEVQMATVQAKLQGYSEVQTPGSCCDALCTSRYAEAWQQQADLPPLQLRVFSCGLSHAWHTSSQGFLYMWWCA